MFRQIFYAENGLLRCARVFVKWSVIQCFLKTSLLISCIGFQINIDLDNPGLHSIPICDEHFTALEHLMICAMCKRRLARNHIHYLGPEVKELNEALKDDGK